MHLMLITAWLAFPSMASKISIEYEKPAAGKYFDIYKTLKSNNRSMLDESARYLEQLYEWPEDIKVVVTTCGFVNSRYRVDEKMVIICYETLYRKIYDYAKSASSKEIYTKRVLQNTLFTFWHEIGHAAIELFNINPRADVNEMEALADEFATLSMIWRTGEKWKGLIMISALHFKAKSVNQPQKKYDVHPDDLFRYQKMVALLYGFAPKSYSRLSLEVSQMVWLDKSARAYYLERSTFWKTNLRSHTRRDFFIN